MLGFRPEPIAIPIPATNATLDIPTHTTCSRQSGSTCDPPDGVGSSSSAVEPSTSRFTISASNSRLSDSIQNLDRMTNPDVHSTDLVSTSEIQPSDLQVLSNIGHGSSGVVQKVLHMPSDSVLALKVIAVEANEAKRKQILLELKTLHESMHPSIVSFYGAFFREGAVHIALEYMDASLLDLTRAAGMTLAEPILAAMTRPVIDGLAYMHRELHMIHRDIKPANILVDSGGQIKIADFGVSGELHETLAKCASWVGTVHYMSPERIQGGVYSYDSDVWSLGITLLELATRSFPYPNELDGRRLSFWDLLDAIVESPPPTPPAHFSPEFHALITSCLQKAPEARASSTQLMSLPLILRHSGAATRAEATAWICEAISHLPPPSESSGQHQRMDTLARELEASMPHGDFMTD